MKDLITCLPVGFSMLAQIPQNQDSYERMGIAAISLGATAFLWRFFVGRENAAQARRDVAEAMAQEKRDKLEAYEKEERKGREAADIAERNRLLEVANKLQVDNIALQRQMVEILNAQSQKSDVVALTLDKARIALERAQKDAQRRHEDDHRSIKDIARQIPGSRHVIVDNPVLDVNVTNPEEEP